MWRVIALGPFFVACGFNPGMGTGDDTPPIDARDGSMDEGMQIDARQCFGEGTYEVCINGITPMPAFDLPATLSTDAAPCLATVPGSFWKSNTQPASCVIVAEAINVPVTTTVTGTRPLVLVATGELTIAGELDLSSKQGVENHGPAANSTLCVAPTPPTGTASGGGGPGGSFQTIGGNGGNGQAGNGSTASPEVGPPDILRGGCEGTKGASTLAGPGGASGGAAYLVAGGTITITGTINVSGAGAEAGGLLSGGSGGGSGGMLVLWAPAITATGAHILANGGGGSAGGDDDSVGDAGSDPDDADPAAPATGGSGGGRGGAGGKGYAAPAAATAGSIGNQASDGGGGGGGGAGFIRSNQTLAGSLISPPVIP